MNKISENPIALLLITGLLIGFNFPLGKLAAEAAISPTVWAFVFSLGACLLLFPVLISQKKLVFPRKATLRYIIFSAVLSYIIPNLLLFSVMLRMGAGYMGLMFALSPVFTLFFALNLRMNIPNRVGLTGILFGLIGTAVVSISKGNLPDAPPWELIVLALCVPLCLALGNIYRTLDWPDKGEPDSLAFWSHAIAVLFYSGLIFFYQTDVSFTEMSNTPVVVLLQLVVSGLIFPAFFRLQKVGGPVLLSQIGYISAAVGLVCAVLFLGERYDVITWVGAAIIAFGIALSIQAQRQKTT